MLWYVYHCQIIMSLSLPLYQDIGYPIERDVIATASSLSISLIHEEGNREFSGSQ